MMQNRRISKLMFVFLFFVIACSCRTPEEDIRTDAPANSSNNSVVLHSQEPSSSNQTLEFTEVRSDIQRDLKDRLLDLEFTGDVYAHFRNGGGFNPNVIQRVVLAFDDGTKEYWVYRLGRVSDGIEKVELGEDKFNAFFAEAQTWTSLAETFSSGMAFDAPSSNYKHWRSDNGVLKIKKRIFIGFLRSGEGADYRKIGVEFAKLD